MKLIAACLICTLLVVMLGGCKAAGTDTNPFASLNTQVTIADTAVKVETLAVSTGVAVDPKIHEAASVMYTVESDFVSVLVPLEEGLAVTLAAPTLEAGAITKATLDANILKLKQDMVVFATALNVAAPGAVGAMQAAVKPTTK